MPWASSHGSDFNYDFHAIIDPSVAPAGRSDGPFMSWLRRHDEYGAYVGV